MMALITSLSELYARLDLLYGDLKVVCATCTFPCCHGYVWLLEDEVNRLVEQGVDVIEVNGTCNFIDSFIREGERIRVDLPKPPCHYKSGQVCSIHAFRSLVCRMYPVGIHVVDDDLSVVLHLDCHYAELLQGDAKQDFFGKVSKIIQDCSLELIQELMRTYREVDAISALPDGPNRVELITTFESVCS